MPYLRSLRNTGTWCVNLRTTIPCSGRRPSILPGWVFWNGPFPAAGPLRDCAASNVRCGFPIPTRPPRVRGPFRDGQQWLPEGFPDIWTVRESAAPLPDPYKQVATPNQNITQPVIIGITAAHCATATERDNERPDSADSTAVNTVGAGVNIRLHPKWRSWLPVHYQHIRLRTSSRSCLLVLSLRRTSDSAVSTSSRTLPGTLNERVLIVSQVAFVFFCFGPRCCPLVGCRHVRWTTGELCWEMGGSRQGRLPFALSHLAAWTPIVGRKAPSFELRTRRHQSGIYVSSLSFSVASIVNRYFFTEIIIWFHPSIWYCSRHLIKPTNWIVSRTM